MCYVQVSYVDHARHTAYLPTTIGSHRIDRGLWPHEHNATTQSADAYRRCGSRPQAYSIMAVCSVSWPQRLRCHACFAPQRGPSEFRFLTQMLIRPSRSSNVWAVESATSFHPPHHSLTYLVITLVMFCTPVLSISAVADASLTKPRQAQYPHGL